MIWRSINLKNRTTIQIEHKTLEELREMKIGDETYEKLLRRLMSKTELKGGKTNGIQERNGNDDNQYQKENEKET